MNRGFWSRQRIEKEQEARTLIEPKELFKRERTKYAAYELALSRDALTTPDGTERADNPGKEGMLLIPSGGFGLLYTEERVSIPPNAIAFISIKATIKLQGLVNVSGFHVDPGFKGRLQFSVYNAGNEDVYIKYGEPCFIILFADLDQETDESYDGKHKGQNGITPDDCVRMSYSTHSPAALNQRIEKVEDNIERIFAVGVIVIAPLLIGLLVAAFDHWFGQNEMVGIGGSLVIALALCGTLAGLIYRRQFKTKSRN